MPRDASIRLGLHDEHANLGDHIAYFWETPAEFTAAVKFLEVGLDLGDCCVIFGHEEANAKVRARLAECGYNCDRLESSGLPGRRARQTDR